MEKEEYNKIIELLDNKKYDEIRDYVEKRKDIKYIKGARKAIMSLIDSSCLKDYPSYYQRTHHQGIVKTYLGFYEKTEKGFILVHDNSNIFEIYNDEILTPDIEGMLRRSLTLGDSEDRLKQLKIIKNIISSLENEGNMIIDRTEEGYKEVKAYADYCCSSVVIPSDYYNITHKLLGEDTEEYIYDCEMGLYFKSSKGKALILGIKK